MASHNGVVGCTECRMTKHTGHGRYFVHGDGAWERFPKKRGKKSKAPPSYHNSPRPEGGYDNANLPMRSHEDYMSTMKAWHEADGPSARDDIRTKSGIKRPVLAAKSPLFDAPAFFPIDSSHLLWLNIPFNMINLFRRMDDNEHLVKFLNIADRMMSTQSRQVPSSFGSSAQPISYYTTQYKMFEYIQFILWYSIPAMCEAAIHVHHPVIYKHWVLFVQICVQISSLEPITERQRLQLKADCVEFANMHEDVWVNPTNPKFIAKHQPYLDAFPIAFHRIIHLADTVRTFGLLYQNTQLPLERKMGDLKRTLKAMTFPNVHMIQRVSGNTAHCSLLR